MREIDKGGEGEEWKGKEGRGRGKRREEKGRRHGFESGG